MDINSTTVQKATPVDRDIVLIKGTTSLWLLVLVAASLDLWSSTGPLPLSYFVLISVAVTIVFVEVLLLHDFGEKESVIGLLQLSTTMVFWQLSERLRFASIPGYDTYAHRMVIRAVLQTGHVDLSLGTSGAAFPAMNLLLTQLLQFGAIDERLAFSLAAALGVVSVVLLFLVARLFVAPKWAMVAAIVLAASPYFKWWNEVEITPTTIAILLALVTLYAFLSETKRGDLRLRTLGIVAMVGLIISHPIITLFVLWALICVGAFQVLGRTRRLRVRSLGGSVILMATLTLAYWMYLTRLWEISVSMFVSVLSVGILSLPLHIGLGLTLTEQLVGLLPWTVMTIVGARSVLQWIRNPFESVPKAGWGVMSAGLVLVLGAALVSGGYFGAFANRWLLLLEIAACLPFANSLRVLVSTKRRSMLLAAITITTVVLLSSSVSPYASLYQTGHNPLPVFSEGEMAGMAFAGYCTQTTVADSYSAVYLHLTYNRSTADLYGYSVRIPLNSRSACILVQSGSNLIYTKTTNGTSILPVDNQDFGPSLATLRGDFRADLNLEWTVDKVFDDGDTVWYYSS